MHLDGGFYEQKLIRKQRGRSPKTDANNNPETAPANAADKVGGISISLSLGASSSQANSQSSADSARGSTLNAGGNIHIQAVGDGQASNLTVRGSDIQAAGQVQLKADNQIKLLAAQNTTQESSSNQSANASVGIGVSLGNAGGGGSSGPKMGITVSASLSKGQGAGNSTTYSNTHVQGGQVSLESGGDTTLQGAVVKGNQVSADVGGNLNIESLQDSNQYKQSSASVGGSYTFGGMPPQQPPQIKKAHLRVRFFFG